MKFKADKGTDTYNRLNEVMDKITAARAAAAVIVEEFGAEEYASVDRFGGGIIGIVLPHKPDGWKGYKGKYFPKISPENKALLERIEALPFVSFKDVNSAVGYKASFLEAIGLSDHEDYFLFTIPEKGFDNYQHPPDVTELTETQYRNLKNTALGQD